MMRTDDAELVSAADAQAHAEKLARNGVRILGVEGFRIEGGRRVPQMHLIADLSGAETVESALKSTLTFLQSAASDRNVFYEFTT